MWNGVALRLAFFESIKHVINHNKLETMRGGVQINTPVLRFKKRLSVTIKDIKETLTLGINATRRKSTAFNLRNAGLQKNEQNAFRAQNGGHRG